MTAEGKRKFIKRHLIDCDTDQIHDGSYITIKECMELMEAYHQAKLKEEEETKSFYCYNKEKGFVHSLCELSQCERCKNVDKQVE